MATVIMEFDGGDVPVITGAQPASPGMPITKPTYTGGITNTPFVATPGIRCYALDTEIPYTPLWQLGQVIDGIQLKLVFKKVAPC